jgi:hypothetical protein
MGGSRGKIILVENDKIISDDKEVAQTFNDYFENVVKSLGILPNEPDVPVPSQGKVLDAIKMYETHPSIIKIKENVVVGKEFSFYPVRISALS